jgi:toxin FitB
MKNKMAFLLDTCALSELSEKKPNLSVVRKLLALPRDDLFISTISLGEITYGIELLPPSRRRNEFEAWFEQSVLAVFQDRLLPIDMPVARRWGELEAEVRKQGLTMQVKDSLIAATALVHGLTVVTRNDADFAPSGVAILNPWK